MKFGPVYLALVALFFAVGGYELATLERPLPLTVVPGYDGANARMDSLAHCHGQGGVFKDGKCVSK